ncbi:MAG: ATP-binding cassette domain-containing protein [Eubacteriaceae bacterium]|nr:ATP-binding cassette domain-containing protein [Eubacteriaceae bacterium]
MIKFDNIQKSFGIGTPDEMQLFNGFNLEVSEGEFVSIVGSNGSGKTTLLNILCGSMLIEGGRLLLDGADITKLSEHERAKYLGRVFQDPQKGTCSDLTILENMALADNKNKKFGLGAAINKKRIDHYKELLEPCQMGLENRLGTLVGTLSGGQRQALALIISNMADIRLLVLDEHTAALDPKSSELVMELTTRFVKEHSITTLMVTHNLRYAVDHGSRLLMLDKGLIVLDRKGKEKEQTTVESVLHIFNEISIESGN